MKAKHIRTLANGHKVFRVLFFGVGPLAGPSVAFDRSRVHSIGAHTKWVETIKNANLPPISKPAADVTPIFHPVR